jgi:VWFA-related protein
MHANTSFRARWAARLAAGLLCLAVALPLTATALAQAIGPTVAVTGVDSKAFPTVSAAITVTGNNGLPLVGLTTANFTVTEDGKPVSPASLALDSDISQQLNLVLAVDVSVNAAGLAQVQSAADDFIATLSPTDQVAIVSFYDQVDIVQAFTSDKNTLKGAIDNLTAGGNGTAFNAAADKAVSLLAALPPGRKAVVMFTNSGDTTNDLAPEPILASAQAATVRIYPMAFGTTVNADLMRNWARFTGGQAYLLASATEIRPNLLTLGVLLRQSYKLSFKSGLSADNKTHAITIIFSYQGQVAQGQGSFTAFGGQVEVVGPGITNGQTVRGRVFLIAEVNSPAPVKSVTFQLDGQDLTSMSAPPFRFDWDSTTASPGVHTLTIKAVDQVGNQGQSQVTVNVVLPPVAVVTATPARAAATAQAQAAQPSVVETLQTKALPVVGRVAAGLALLVGALVAFFLWLSTLRSQRQVQEKICGVEVQNQGNVRSRYELRAEDPSGNLKFEFMLNDTDLAQRVGEPVDAKTAVAAGIAPARVEPEAKQPNPTVTKVKDTWQKANALENKAVATVNTGSVLSNWIVTVSYLLPGTLGETLRESTAGMRSTQYEVRNVVDAPGRYQRMVAAAAPPRISTNPNMPLNTGNQLPATWSKTGTPSNGANATTAPAAVAQPKPVARSGWSLTPPIDAGDALTVTLKVRPARFPRAQHYDFKVLSRSVDGNESVPVIDHGSVALRRGPIFRRILSWVLLVLAVALLALLAWYLLTTFNLVHLPR